MTSLHLSTLVSIELSLSSETPLPWALNCSYFCYNDDKDAVMLLAVICLQINQLVNAGANVLAPIAVGPQRQIGTVVDYAYYVYSFVRIICNMLFMIYVTVL